MGQLLDIIENNPKIPEANVEEKEAPKKSLLQQLYELQGLEVDVVTTTTTTNYHLYQDQIGLRDYIVWTIHEGAETK